MSRGLLDDFFAILFQDSTEKNKKADAWSFDEEEELCEGCGEFYEDCTCEDCGDCDSREW